MNKEIEAVLSPSCFLPPPHPVSARLSLSHLPLLFPGVDHKDEPHFLLLGWSSPHSHFFSLTLLHLLFPPGFIHSPTFLKKKTTLSCLELPSGFRSRDVPRLRPAYFVLRVVFILCHPKNVPLVLSPKEPYSSRAGLLSRSNNHFSHHLGDGPNPGSATDLLHHHGQVTAFSSPQTPC